MEVAIKEQSQKFSKFSNGEQMAQIIYQSPNEDILESFSQLEIDENYALEIIKILVNIKDKVLVGVLYHASLNEKIIQKKKNVEIISVLATAAGARQAYEAIELIMRADYDEELLLKLIPIIVNAKNEFTANAARKVALNPKLIEHEKLFEIIKIVAQLDSKFSDIWQIVKFINANIILEYENADELLKIYTDLTKHKKGFVKKMMSSCIDNEEIPKMIAIISDYKSITRLQGASDYMFETELGDEKEIVFETFNHFKDIDDEFSLFSCTELFEEEKPVIRVKRKFNY